MRWKDSALLALALLITLPLLPRVGSIAVHAQSCPLFVPEGVTPATLDTFVRKTDLTCQAVDGVYMLQYQQVRLDSVGTEYGTCLNQTWNCEFIKREERDVNHTDSAVEYQLDGYGSFLWGGYYSAIRPLVGSGLHVLDSRNADTNGPPIATLSYVGTTKFSFQSGLNATNCNISPRYGPLKTLSINVVKCLPKFWMTERGLEHVQAGPVTIYVPPELAGTSVDLAAGHARDVWNTRLHDYGNPVTISLSYFECSGPGCIHLEEGPPPPNSPSNCGETWSAADSSQGAWQSPAHVRVRETWSSWTDQTFLDWLLAHEMGHALGLDENNCPLASSLMGPFNACGQHMNSTGPSVSDGMPVKKTTYDPQGTTAVCQ